MRSNALFGALLCGLVLTSFASAQDAIRVVNGGSTFDDTTMTVEMDAAMDVQGYVLAIAYDSNNVEVVAADVSSNVAMLGAELVAFEPFPAENGFTLGVILDASSPFDGQVIAAGTGIDIANFDVDVLSNPAQGDADEVVNFSLVDQQLNDPLLDNVLVQNGQSLSVAQLNLSLENGTLTITPLPPGTLTIQDTQALSTVATGPSSAAAVPVLLDSPNAQVQGWAIAIGHNSADITLASIAAGADAAAAGVEFEAPSLFTNGGTYGVVLDFEAPFDGQTLQGTGLEIATYNYYCNAEIVVEELIDPVAQGLTTDLIFQDATFGSPLIDNVLVISGQSVAPILANGTFTCLADVPPPAVVFTLGGKPDENGNPTDIVGAESPEGWEDPANELEPSKVEVGIYYQAGFNVQAFQFALCYEAGLIMCDFSVDEAITGAVGAEFVNWNTDGAEEDVLLCGNEGPVAGREATIGIQLDALPPFDGQTAPQTVGDQQLLAGCASFIVDSNVLNGNCSAELCIDFCADTAQVGENPPIQNLVVVDFAAFQDVTTNSTTVTIEDDGQFVRGDCSFDNDPNSDDFDPDRPLINLADSTLLISGLLFPGEFSQGETDCEDACDVNDDGKLNLADAILILDYLFKNGDEPAQPFPNAGSDPTTEEPLGCDRAIDCAL